MIAEDRERVMKLNQTMSCPLSPPATFCCALTDREKSDNEVRKKRKKWTQSRSFIK